MGERELFGLGGKNTISVARIRVEVLRDGEWHDLVFVREIDLQRHVDDPSAWKLLVHGTLVRDPWRVWKGDELLAASAPPDAVYSPRLGEALS